MRSVIYKSILTRAWIIMLMMILACSNDSKTIGVPSININPKIDFIDYSLSEISSNLEIVKLETTENSIIGSMSNLVYLDKEVIVYRSGKTVIIFDGKGKFLFKIDSVGNGPTEYNTIITVFVEEEKELIYIVDYKKILSYNFKGAFQGKLNMDIDSPGGIFRTSTGNYIVPVKQNYKDEHRKMLYIYDSIFDVLKTFDSKNNEELEVKQEFFYAGNPYEIDNQIFYKEVFVDTIYKLENDDLKPHWIISSGDYKMDFNDILTINKSSRSKDRISVPNIIETQNLFFLSYYFQEANYYSIFDKKLNRFVFHNKYTQEDFLENEGRVITGIKNDLTDDGVHFWPAYVDDKVMVNTAHPNNFSERQLAKLNCNIYDNPIIFICKNE